MTGRYFISSGNNLHYDNLAEPDVHYNLQLATPQEVEAVWKGCKTAISGWLAKCRPRTGRSSDITKKLK